MYQNSIVIHQRYKKFLEEVTQNEIVWALKSEEGFVTSSSTLYEDNNGEDIKLYCFWSNDKLARVCKNKFCSECNLIEIPLSEFLENWCLGLHYNDLMIGTNFDWNLFGQEVEPIVLILEIVKELKKKRKGLSFKNFISMKDLESQIKVIYDEMYSER